MSACRTTGTFFRTMCAASCAGRHGTYPPIGRTDRPAATNPFITRYIFPGGYIPALQRDDDRHRSVGSYRQRCRGSAVALRRDAARWRHRFLAHRPAAVEIAGEEFCRRWEFYLAGSEAAFRFPEFRRVPGPARAPRGCVAHHRGYMTAAEEALMVTDAAPAG